MTTPTWLARAGIGVAHAFMPSSERGRDGHFARSVCGHVERQDGSEWEAPQPERAKCGTCVLRLRAAAKARARADKEGL